MLRRNFQLQRRPPSYTNNFMKTNKNMFSVIPATSCSSERSFSSLRRLKTYLRNTMGQERLSNLAIMSIETAFVNRVISEDIEDIIKAFASNHSRHSLLY